MARLRAPEMMRMRRMMMTTAYDAAAATATITSTTRRSRRVRTREGEGERSDEQVDYKVEKAKRSERASERRNESSAR